MDVLRTKTSGRKIYEYAKWILDGQGATVGHKSHSVDEIQISSLNIEECCTSDDERFVYDEGFFDNEEILQEL